MREIGGHALENIPTLFPSERSTVVFISLNSNLANVAATPSDRIIAIALPLL
jgi:hypothetical protein